MPLFYYPCRVTYCLLDKISPKPMMHALMRSAFPLIGAQLILLLVQLSDIWIVSRLGHLYLAAAGSSLLVIMTIIAFGSGFLTSVAALAGQAYGAGKISESSQIAWQGVLSAIFLGILSATMIPIADSIFSLVGHELHVRKLECLYFKISMLSMGPQMVGIALNYYYLSTHRSGAVFLGGTILLFSNIFFSCGLVFGIFGLPKLGFEGGPLGTLIASSIHCVLMVAFFVKKRIQGKEFIGIAFQIKAFFKLARLGIPAGIQDAVEWGALGCMIVVLVGKFGEEDIAASAVLLRCMQIAILPADGLGLALLGIVANEVGAGRIREARTVVFLGLRMIALYMCSIAVLFFVLRAPLMEVFCRDPLIISLGIDAMLFVSIFQIFDSINVTYSHALQGAGDCAWPSIVNLTLSITILVLGGFFVVDKYLFLGSSAIWFLVAAVSVCQGCAFCARWHFGPWHKEIEVIS